MHSTFVDLGRPLPNFVCYYFFSRNEMISSPVTSTIVWISKDMKSSGVGIAYLALGLQAGYVEVHALEPPRLRTQNSLLSLLKNMENRVS
uniref:Transposase n=1 Tax=Heterorhabditis bacteriophora TaxID=37862 RepID=A0A1I7XB03_HETBA